MIPDDGPPYVRSVTYLMPEVGTGLPDALIVTLRMVAADVARLDAADREATS